MDRRGAKRAAAVRRLGGIKLIAIDVDGTMTDGKMIVDSNGLKPFKNFGADDSDAIKEALSLGIDVVFITADKAGIAMAQHRANSIGIPCYFSEGKNRVSVLSTLRYSDLATIAYIGDGYYDGETFKMVGFGLATANALPHTKKHADAILSRAGGNKAVAQAIRFIGENLR